MNNNHLNELEQILNKDNSIYDIGLVAYGGSIAYGLNNENSDIDYRGYFLSTPSDILLQQTDKVIDINDGLDITFYSYYKLINLLKNSNPNIIEFLGLDDESILKDSKSYKLLRDNKNIFISKKCASSFGGYAMAQLRRIENALARDSEEKRKAYIESAYRSTDSAINNFDKRYSSYSNGNKIEVNKKEEDIFFDFYFKNIPAKQLTAMVNDINQIQKNAEKLASRNNKKDAKHMSKHMSHLLRLLRMGSEILEKGEIIVKRTDDRDLLMSIKNGDYINEDNGIISIKEEFWELLNKEQKRFDYAKSNSDLKDSPDFDSINELLFDTHKEVVLNN